MTDEHFWFSKIHHPEFYEDEMRCANKVFTEDSRAQQDFNQVLFLQYIYIVPNIPRIQNFVECCIREMEYAF